MASASLEIVQQQANNVAQLYAQWQEAKKEVTEIETGVQLFSVWGGNQVGLPELQRQYDYHIGRGDIANANIVKPHLETAKSVLSQKRGIADVAKQAYDEALKEYKASSSSLLTPAEQAQVQQGLDAQTKANYATGTTKYWIIGGVILVIVIIAGVVIYFKTKKGA